MWNIPNLFRPKLRYGWLNKVIRRNKVNMQMLFCHLLCINEFVFSYKGKWEKNMNNKKVGHTWNLYNVRCNEFVRGAVHFMESRTTLAGISVVFVRILWESFCSNRNLLCFLEEWNVPQICLVQAVKAPLWIGSFTGKIN